MGRATVTRFLAVAVALTAGCPLHHERPLPAARTGDRRDAGGPSDAGAAGSPPTPDTGAPRPATPFDAAVRRDGGSDVGSPSEPDGPMTTEPDAPTTTEPDSGPGTCRLEPCLDGVAGIANSWVSDDWSTCGSVTTTLDHPASALGACAPDASRWGFRTCGGPVTALRIRVVEASPGAWLAVGEISGDGTCACEREETFRSPAPGDAFEWPPPSPRAYREIVLRGNGVRVRVEACGRLPP